VISFHDAYWLAISVFKQAPNSTSYSSGRISLPVLFALLLVLAIVARLGVAVLGLTGDIGEVPATTAARTPAEASARVDLQALQALHLFSGSRADVQVAAAVLPTGSNLNLLLQGVILGAQAQSSVAIIVSNARQASYHVGDVLPGAGSIVLTSIAADHVVVDNNGRLETLQLYAEQDNGRVIPVAPTGAVPLEVTGRLGGRTAEGLPVVAATLSEIIRVQPAQENGQLIGYRLSPGEKVREFVQLGLETNDVVTQVNGLALNDMANMPRLYALMNEATEVSFLLLREGRPMTLQFALTDSR
jgi:general secretion pathway protein C